MDFFTGGGFLGNLIRGLGQKFGLGKRFDQPTYDMSRFSGLPMGGLASLQNLDIRDIYDRRKTDEEEDTDLKIGDFNRDYFDDNSLRIQQFFKNYLNRPTNITPGGTVLYDEFPSTEIDYGNPTGDFRVVPEEMGLVGDRGIMSVI